MEFTQNVEKNAKCSGLSFAMYKDIRYLFRVFEIWNIQCCSGEGKVFFVSTFMVALLVSPLIVCPCDPVNY